LVNASILYTFKQDISFERRCETKSGLSKNKGGMKGNKSSEAGKVKEQKNRKA